MSAVKTGAVLALAAILAGGLYAGYRSHRARRAGEELDRALRLRAAGRHSAAAEAFQALYAASPQTAEGREAMYRCGLSREESGQWDKAGEVWAEVLADPGSRAYHSAAALGLARASLATGRAGEAKSRIDRFFAAYPESSLAGDAYFLLAEARAREGDLAGAAEAARKVAEEYSGCGSAAKAQALLGDLNVRLLFSRAIVPGTKEYVVQPGDTLEGVSKRTGTAVELLREMNRGSVRGDALRPGGKIKVCGEPFTLLIDKSANTLALKSGERIVKVYSVGTGKEGSTPVGDFKVTVKIEKPEWFRPGGGVIPYGDPANLLGTRWMGINCPGYGIHGTWEPETIGKQASAGCVRMLNSDVEELYKIVPAGARVTIVE